MKAEGDLARALTQKLKTTTRTNAEMNGKTNDARAIGETLFTKRISDWHELLISVTASARKQRLGL